MVRVRTNMRHEDVHIFPVALPADKQRDLFLQFVGLGNQLAEKAKFYNTITANCTSTVFLLVRTFQPNLPLDRRIIPVSYTHLDVYKRQARKLRPHSDAAHDQHLHAVGQG